MSLLKRFETPLPNGETLIEEFYRGYEPCKARAEEMGWTLPCCLAFLAQGGTVNYPYAIQIERYGKDGYWRTQNNTQ